jgi:hypothetical protein
MRCTRNLSSLLSLATTSCLAIVGGLFPTDSFTRPPLHEMSCFTIGAVVECIDSGFIMPPMIVGGGNDEGTNETLVIEDNGGYHEVRG